MNHNLQIFKYNDAEVRTVIRDGAPWWVLKDVCDVLEIGNSRMVADRLDEDEKADVSLTDTSSNGVTQSRSMTIITESGLYNVVLRSDKPEAKNFKRWITHEVLPAIRKHGGKDDRNELQIIEQREVLGKDFKIYGDAENPLFLARGVAEWIEHSNPTEMLRGVEESERLNSTILSAGQRREVTFLTEDGLYEVLMQSRKPIARQFKQAVKEILRSIRKHGAYMTPDTLDRMISTPEFGIKLLTALKDEQDKNKALQSDNSRLVEENDKQKQVIGELKPAKDYVDYILSSPGTMAITQIAADYGMSAQRLNKILWDENVQRPVNGQWILYAAHMDKGYTKSETIPIERSDGRPDTKLLTKWTQKGRLYINDVLNRRGYFANMDRKAAA